jgi:hypothetical protein
MHRFLSLLVAGAIALAVSTAPAVASDGYSGNHRAENAPAAVVGAAPVFPDADAVQTRTLGVAPSTAPQGAVSAGEGGSSEDGRGGPGFAIGAAALVILAAAGGLAVAARRGRS